MRPSASRSQAAVRPSPSVAETGRPHPSYATETDEMTDLPSRRSARRVVREPRLDPVRVGRGDGAVVAVVGEAEARPEVVRDRGGEAVRRVGDGDVPPPVGDAHGPPAPVVGDGERPRRVPLRIQLRDRRHAPRRVVRERADRLPPGEPPRPPQDLRAVAVRVVLEAAHVAERVRHAGREARRAVEPEPHEVAAPPVLDEPDLAEVGRVPPHVVIGRRPPPVEAPAAEDAAQRVEGRLRRAARRVRQRHGARAGVGVAVGPVGEKAARRLPGWLRAALRVLPEEVGLPLRRGLVLHGESLGGRALPDRGQVAAPVVAEEDGVGLRRRDGREERDAALGGPPVRRFRQDGDGAGGVGEVVADPVQRQGRGGPVRVVRDLDEGDAPGGERDGASRRVVRDGRNRAVRGADLAQERVGVDERPPAQGVPPRHGELPRGRGVGGRGLRAPVGGAGLQRPLPALRGREPDALAPRRGPERTVAVRAERTLQLGDAPPVAGEAGGLGGGRVGELDGERQRGGDRGGAEVADDDVPLPRERDFADEFRAVGEVERVGPRGGGEESRGEQEPREAAKRFGANYEQFFHGTTPLVHGTTPLVCSYVLPYTAHSTKTPRRAASRSGRFAKTIFWHFAKCGGRRTAGRTR